MRQELARSARSIRSGDSVRRAVALAGAPLGGSGWCSAAGALGARHVRARGRVLSYELDMDRIGTCKNAIVALDKAVLQILDALDFEETIVKTTAVPY